MINTSKLTEILRDAVSDYSANAGNKAPADWLQGYLGEKLTNKTPDTIKAISSEIISTLDLMEQKKAAMNAALEDGVSAENWLTDEVMEQTGGNGSKALMAAKFMQGLVAADANTNEPIEVEVLDPADANWSDESWNDYKLKDSVKGVAIEAGMAGMREIASDVFQKAAEDGVAGVLTDGEFIADTLTHGACEGLKIAVSAGLAVAEDKEIIPPTTFKVLATVAHRTVESFSAFRDVVKGKATVTEALIKIKNTAVSTFSGMMSQYKDAIKSEIIDAASDVFGAKGAAIAGAVVGFFTPPKEGSRIVNAIKEAGKATWRFLTKERHLPFFNKNKQIDYNQY